MDFLTFSFHPQLFTTKLLGKIDGEIVEKRSRRLTFLFHYATGEQVSPNFTN